MSVSHREFLFREDGTVVRIPNPKMWEVYCGRQPLKEFAGKKVRWLSVLVELKDRKPIRIFRPSATMLYFDRRGFMRKDKEREHRQSRRDAGFSWEGTPGRAKETEAQRKARERLQPEWEWEPTPEEKAAVEKLIWPKGKP